MVELTTQEVKFDQFTIAIAAGCCPMQLLNTSPIQPGRGDISVLQRHSIDPDFRTSFLVLLKRMFILFSANKFPKTTHSQASKDSLLGSNIYPFPRGPAGSKNSKLHFVVFAVVVFYGLPQGPRFTFTLQKSTIRGQTAFQNTEELIQTLFHQTIILTHPSEGHCPL